MSQMIRYVLLPVVLALLGGLPAQRASAETVEIQAQGSVSYGWRLKPEDRQQALRAAKERALETYVARDSKSLSRYFASVRPEIGEQLDRFVLSSTILEETEDKKAKTYTVYIRAEVDVNGFRAYLEGSSQTLQASASGLQSEIAIFFLVREQAAVQSFDDKVYTRTDSASAANQSVTMDESSSESEAIDQTGIQTSGGFRTSSNSEVGSSTITTTGGSTTRKSDRIEWVIGEANDFSSLMQGVLVDAGFSIAEVELIEGIDFSAIRAEYSTSQNLSPRTLQTALKSVRAAGKQVFALGTADVGVRDIDPVTGNVRVNVRVSGRVYDLRGNSPLTLAGVGPIQISGQNVDESSAQSDALGQASEIAAQSIVDALNAKGFR